MMILHNQRKNNKPELDKRSTAENTQNGRMSRATPKKTSPEAASTNKNSKKTTTNQYQKVNNNSKKEGKHKAQKKNRKRANNQ